jgi:hypothetical protein
MASLSDGGPGWSNGEVWARHGYLITFEGLLSAVGKELGMIEGELSPVLIFALERYKLRLLINTFFQMHPLPSRCSEWLASC